VRLDVFFGGHQMTPADVQGRVVLVIDVLRASTTVAVALANGAKAVIPFESSDEVVARAKQFERDDVLLAGERRMHAIPGFDLGNSPREYSAEAVEGKTVLLTTTNGTVALAGIQGARDVVVASYVNYSAVRAGGCGMCRPFHARRQQALHNTAQRRSAGLLDDR
jgi:2-phosphosulfolactate phosphatase